MRNLSRRVSTGWKLVIRWLPEDITIGEVRRLMADFGDVMSIDLWDLNDAKTAVIEYVRECDVEKAFHGFYGRRMADGYLLVTCNVVR